MIEAWVWWAGAALGGAAAAASPSAAAAGAAGVWLVAWRRGVRPAVLVAGAILFVVQGARGWRALERARATHARSVAALTPPGVCSGRAVVIESPIASVRPSGRGEDGSFDVYTRAMVSVHHGECEGRPLPEGLVARLYDLPGDLRRGDEIDFAAKLAATHLFEHAELPSPWPAVARSGLAASGAAIDVVVVERPLSAAGAIDAARAHVRRRVLATYAPEAAGLGRALVLGETDLAEDEVIAFRDSGLLHLLAVSGSHLVLVVAALSGALRRALLYVAPVAARVDAGRVAAALGIGAAWLYADFAGGSGSAVRAAAMLTVALLAKALGHRPAAGRALAVSLLAAALIEPLVALDVSFSLSAGATVGLVVLGKPLGDRLLALAGLAAQPVRETATARGEGDGLVRLDARSPEPDGEDRRGDGPPTDAVTACPAEPAREALHVFARLRGALGALSRIVLVSVGTTLAATIGSLPAMLRFSPRLPVLGVLANVIAAPLGELMALPVCLAHAALCFVPPVERALGLAGSGALLVVRAIAHATAGAGGGVGVPPPSVAQLAAAAIGVAAIATARRKKQRLPIALAAAAVLLLLEGAQRRAGAPRGLLRVTALDVAQGDALLVDFPDGRSMLIDGGGMVGNPVDPGARVVLPVLAARRRTSVDVLALTHPHPDHFTGLATVARAIPFGELWDTGQGEQHGAHGAYGALLAAAREKGAAVRRPADLCGEPRDFGGARVTVLWPCPSLDPALSANDSSLVMRIDFGERSALLVGDAEHEAEAALLASGAHVRADLLKVGHHGSRTSSSAAFLRAVSPEVAMISCGVRNRFGHPHPTALARLSVTGAAIARTDRGGAVVWETDGHDAWLRRP